MTRHQPRTFAIAPPTAEPVPLLIGLMGPSGSGKTFSALRLATGITRETGGKIVFIDTEARRAAHYRTMFDFLHLPFDPPFGSLDYLDAIRQAHKEAGSGGVVIVDSMSHEHEGKGGMLDFHEAELDRMAGSDWSKRERVKMLAWQKPKAARRELVIGLLQISGNFIFCFRAKESAKPVKNPQTGKQEVVQMGFMPIAGDEFVYEMTTCALLLPGARGVPTWRSENFGESQMIKLPEQFVDAFSGRAGQPLDEDLGTKMARWAWGGAGNRPAAAPQPPPSPPPAAPGAPMTPAQRNYVNVTFRDALDACEDAVSVGALFSGEKDARAALGITTNSEAGRAIVSMRDKRLEQIEEATNG